MKKLPYKTTIEPIENEFSKILFKRVTFIQAVSVVMLGVSILTLITGIMQNNILYSILGAASGISVALVYKASFTKQYEYAHANLSHAVLTGLQNMLKSERNLDLSLAEIESLGLARAWGNVKSGEILGSTASIESTENQTPRFHSLVAVKADENNFTLYETDLDTRVKLLA